MHDGCLAAIKSHEAILSLGKKLGDIFDAYAKIWENAGVGNHRMNAKGYSLGNIFLPNWMDWPMFYRVNEVIIKKYDFFSKYYFNG